MNWLDVLILVLLVITLVLGLVKGLVRQIVGIASVIAGLILAVLYFKPVSSLIRGFVSSDLLRHFIGFLAVFAAVLAAGSLLGWLLGKAMVGPLRFLNHVAGGALGLVKGVLISGVVVLALLLLDDGHNAPIRNTLMTSRLAPPCYRATRALVLMIPQSLRETFTQSTEKIRGGPAEHGQKI